jgi:2-phosphosulfolactate phosphatase
MDNPQTSTNRLDDRLIERCEEIPESPSPGDYVVIDTLHFSNTVIELLMNGAKHIHITEERGLEFDYRESNPRAVIGGESTDDYKPASGYDFFNSPSYVQDLDVEDRPVSMTSSNGGRTLTKLRKRTTDEVTVYVGSTMNARPLANHLATRNTDVHLVSAGSKGDVAIEDHIGATLISRQLDGIPVTETERMLFRNQLKRAKGPKYIETNGIRREDVLDYAMDLNSRPVVPKLVGDTLVDVGRPAEPMAAKEQTAD